MEYEIFIGFPLGIMFSGNKEEKLSQYERLKKPINNQETAMKLLKIVSKYLRLDESLEIVLIAWSYPISNFFFSRNLCEKLCIKAPSFADVLHKELKIDANQIVLYSSTGQIKYITQPIYRKINFPIDDPYLMFFVLPCIVFGEEEKLEKWLEKWLEKIVDEEQETELNEIEKILAEHYGLSNLHLLPPVIGSENNEILNDFNEIVNEIISELKKEGLLVKTEPV
ncbi:MAG: hypothetical protein ACP5IZ_11740 [Thermoprotei archaeon]